MTIEALTALEGKFGRLADAKEKQAELINNTKERRIYLSAKADAFRLAVVMINRFKHKIREAE